MTSNPRNADPSRRSPTGTDGSARRDPTEPQPSVPIDPAGSHRPPRSDPDAPDPSSPRPLTKPAPDGDADDNPVGNAHLQWFATAQDRGRSCTSAASGDANP